MTAMRDMTAARDTTGEQGPAQAAGACADCLRRSWLLTVLSSLLEYQSTDHERLGDLLVLSDEDLLRAIGGRRKEELKARYAQFDASREVEPVEGVEGVCRHQRNYPRALRDAGAPRMLHVAGGVARLGKLAAAPTVAIVGSRRATDYGMEMAKSLARGLAASGVTVTSGLDDGIAVAAHAGALEVDGGTVAIMHGGLDTGCAARRRTLYARLTAVGCAVAELPCGSPARRWCYTARARILARLAGLTIVVEADDSPGELLDAHLALALGRTVAAVPGRVTSPVSRGTHALLMAGAQLVRGSADALELLYGVGASPPARAAQPEIPARAAQTGLEPRLRAMLEQVGAGLDTPDKLAGEGDAGEVLMALSELELMGLLARGDGGRYVPRDALTVK
jgi:DNA processing protein